MPAGRSGAAVFQRGDAAGWEGGWGLIQSPYCLKGKRGNAIIENMEENEDPSKLQIEKGEENAFCFLWRYAGGNLRSGGVF